MLLNRATVARSLTWAAAAMLLAGPVEAAGDKPAGKPAKSPSAAAPAAPPAASAAAVAAPAVAVAGTATANQPPSPAEISLRRGLEAYRTGDPARAIGAFSSAMSKGGLSSPSLAKALLYRGLSYRKQGKPAQAIPDLTNALYIKDGLVEAERGEAITARAAAYRDAGIADPTGVPAAAPPAQAAAAPSAPMAPVAVPVASPQAAKASGGAWQTAAAPGAGAPAVAAAEAAQPASSGGIGGFFSNLFGGSGEAAAPAASNDVTTASTGASATAPAPAPTAAVSSWSNTTEVTPRIAKGQRTAAAQPAAAVTTDAVPAAATAPKPGTAGGKYKLQVAAVRSRSEADALAARLTSEHAGKLGGRAPVVEESVFGSMGTFYRVNIGSYAVAAEPDSLCKALRPSGFDCLVVTH